MTSPFTQVRGLTDTASSCWREEWLGSSHPLPSLAVTVLATVVSAAAGRSAAGCALVAATVLTGQLSIGWCNDLLDLGRDRAAGRTDKPLALGQVPPRLVAIACGVAGRRLRAAVASPAAGVQGWRTSGRSPGAGPTTSA